MSLNKFLANTIVIAISLVWILSCTKDKATGPVCTCPDIQPGPAITVFLEQGHKYSWPIFNPNNNNEILYSLRDSSSGAYQLVKYNMASGVKNILLDNVRVSYQPKWSESDWIVYSNHSDNQIWRIKSNGDSLEQISIGEWNFAPVLDASGDHCYWNYSETGGNPYRVLKKNLSTGIVDTIYDKVFIDIDLTLNDEELLVRRSVNNSQEYLSSMNLNDYTFENHYGLGEYEQILGLTWNGSNDKIYFTNYTSGGLKQLDVNTGHVTKFIDHCTSKYYQAIDCSINNKLIAERIDQRNGENALEGYILQRSSIYLIDLNTREEIELPL